MSERLRIQELARLAEAAIDEHGTAPVSGRVRAVPDVRTLRYYTTIGLLDRPSEMQGRTGFYGRRHLWQLVAIKRLQAQGLSLVEIQQRLLGIENRELARLAALPSGFLNEIESRLAEVKTPTQREDTAKPLPRRERFWETAVEEEPRELAPLRPAEQKPQPTLLLPLADGVSLLLEGIDVTTWNEATWRAMQPAIAGLLDALNQAGVSVGTGAAKTSK